MPNSYNLKCPFHVFAFGVACATAAILPAVYLFYMKKPSIRRYGVDNRFTDSVLFNDSIIFMSGQIATGETIEIQTLQILRDIDNVLAKAGSDKENILELTIWLADMADYDRMNAVYDQWIVQGKPPCRACVHAKLAAPEYKIEIRCIAAKK
jgi:enamine deaminase RidA (YjgF/YER057c/UK114 family)